MHIKPILMSCNFALTTYSPTLTANWSKKSTRYQYQLPAVPLFASTVLDTLRVDSLYRFVLAVILKCYSARPRGGCPDMCMPPEGGPTTSGATTPGEQS